MNCSQKIYAQTNYTPEIVIDDKIENVEVFRSEDYGWTFVKSGNSPHRYFYRPTDSSSFIEFFDDDKYLEHASFGGPGFKGKKYLGDKYGGRFIPDQFGFKTAFNAYSENSAILSFDYRYNSVLKYESATTPLTNITSLIQYDNSFYFTASSNDVYTALYKLADFGWEITAGNDFFKDYEVSVRTYDEKNNRLVCATGTTYLKNGIWSFNGGFEELNLNMTDSDFKLENVLGYVYFNPEDKGSPVFSGHYTNDSVGNELYLLQGGSLNLIKDASIEGVYGTSFNGTIFNDHSDLLFNATIMDSISTTNQVISKNGSGAYMLDMNSSNLIRIVNSVDNILRVVSAVRNKDGIYIVGTSTYDKYNFASKYYVYLLKDGNPIVEKIDLKGEYLETNTAELFVSDDIIYFASNKGICKIKNAFFESIYPTTDYWNSSNTSSILLVENNKIYLNTKANKFVYISDSNLSINDRSNQISNFIYPNPVKSILYTPISNGKIIDKISVFNLSGKVLIQQYDNVHHVDVQSLLPGMYIVEMYIEGEKISSKFLKN